MTQRVPLNCINLNDARYRSLTLLEKDGGATDLAADRTTLTSRFPLSPVKP